MRRYLQTLVAAIVLLIVPVGSAPLVAAAEPAEALVPAFEGLWERTDLPVSQHAVDYTWFWGPSPLAGPFLERYLDAPDETRLVVYYDKGRMEITDPAADPDSDWYVTSGLLTRELISGRIQLGDDTHLNAPGGAQVPVAGDPDTTFPTYQDLARLVDQGQPDRTGDHATTVLEPDSLGRRPDAAADPATEFVRYVSYPGPAGLTVGYNIPRAFWDFMTQPGRVYQDGALQEATPLFDWLFVLGYPIADPFWVEVPVGQVTKWVLVQPFERRVLTYTPSNPAGWRVEMGNIGLHYQRWRYQHVPPGNVSGDAGYFGLGANMAWRYDTTAGHVETWRITGTTEHFSAGSTLITRRQHTSERQVVTYWSVTPDGADLYGYDTRDADGTLVDTTVYWPPVRYLPATPFTPNLSWETTTTALSIAQPAQHLTINFEAIARQLVATPAGRFLAWRINITTTDLSRPPDEPPAWSVFWFTSDVGVIQWLKNDQAAQLAMVGAPPPDD